LVIGLGSRLRGDDAAGLEVARRLGAPARAYEGEAIGLLDLWEGATAVVLVDTVRSGARPGTIHRIDTSSEPMPTRFRRTSSHAIGVAEAIELARTLGKLPPRVVVYGVEGARFQAGAGLSAEVAAVLDELAGAVRSEPN
jgi:hydrogenase maturation protease